MHRFRVLAGCGAHVAVSGSFLNAGFGGENYGSIVDHHTASAAKARIHIQLLKEDVSTKLHTRGSGPQVGYRNA